MPGCPAADRTRRARYRRVRAALIHPRLPMAVLFFGCATGIGAGKARPLPVPPLLVPANRVRRPRATRSPRQVSAKDRFPPIAVTRWRRPRCPPMPHSRPLPTARAFKSDHQVGPVEGMARTHAQARFCAPKLSAIRAVRATLLGERGCKPSIPMARIVSRYNQRVRQVGFEDESPW